MISFGGDGWLARRSLNAVIGRAMTRCKCFPTTHEFQYSHNRGESRRFNDWVGHEYSFIRHVQEAKRLERVFKLVAEISISPIHHHPIHLLQLSCPTVLPHHPLLTSRSHSYHALTNVNGPISVPQPFPNEPIKRNTAIESLDWIIVVLLEAVDGWHMQVGSLEQVS